MSNTDRLQEVWDAKDLDGVKRIFTEDAVIKILHEDRILKGQELQDRLAAMVLDEDTLSSDFEIIYENEECSVTYERITGQFFGGHVSTVQLWRDGQIYHMQISVIQDNQ